MRAAFVLIIVRGILVCGTGGSLGTSSTAAAVAVAVHVGRRGGRVGVVLGECRRPLGVVVDGPVVDNLCLVVVDVDAVVAVHVRRRGRRRRRVWRRVAERTGSIEIDRGESLARDFGRHGLAKRRLRVGGSRGRGCRGEGGGGEGLGCRIRAALVLGERGHCALGV